MHSQPVDESSGTLSAPRQVINVNCRVCDEPTVTVQTWESHCGGFEDYKYTCGACGHVWWIDGIDS